MNVKTKLNYWFLFFSVYPVGAFGGEIGRQCGKVRASSEERVIKTSKRKSQTCQRKRIIERHRHQ